VLQVLLVLQLLLVLLLLLPVLLLMLVVKSCHVVSTIHFFTPSTPTLAIPLSILAVLLRAGTTAAPMVPAQVKTFCALIGALDQVFIAMPASIAFVLGAVSGVVSASGPATKATSLCS